MRQLRHPLAALIIAGCVLAACGSDDAPAAVGTDSTTAQAPSDTAASPEATDAATDTTQPASSDGDIDCAALKESLAGMTVNWQVVIGLTSQPSSAWGEIPLGNIEQFGDQLDVITAALGSDPDAAEALAFMSGANDIVERGLGGDAAAQADLAEYMGTDVSASVSKQLPIALAYDKAGCN